MAMAKVVAMNGKAAKAGCVLGLLLFARVGVAQNGPGTALPTRAPEAPATAAEPPARPAVPPKITYVGGQLRIDALGSTLATVLTQVAALTGVKIEIPAGADNERMPVVELGPGPARQILASLLSDSNFDYLIQASDADPEKIQSVLLMPREKKGTEAAARAARGPNVAAVAPPEAPPPDAPVAPQPETAGQEASPAPAAMQAADPSATPPNQSGQFPLLQPDSTNPAKPGALTPPSSLSSDSINQQLQQMYQQRAQMTQQDHYTGTQPLPAIPGVK
jgi:hypothetical protein